MGQVQRLCQRAQQGDEHAACELLRLVYAKIFGYLRRLCGNAEDAEDLTQETFVKVWLSLGSFRGRCAFSTWVHKIAYHVYLDHRRRKTGAVQQSDAWWQGRMDKSPGPFKSAEEKQLAEKLYAASEQLDEEKKQVIYLHFYQGLSLRDTAYVLNQPPSTIKYRFRKVMEQLRSEMDDA